MMTTKNWACINTLRFSNSGVLHYNITAKRFGEIGKTHSNVHSSSLVALKNEPKNFDTLDEYNLP